MKSKKKVLLHVTPAKAGVYNCLDLLDSRFCGNENNPAFLTFYEFISHDIQKKS